MNTRSQRWDGNNSKHKSLYGLLEEAKKNIEDAEESMNKANEEYYDKIRKIILKKEELHKKILKKIKSSTIQ